MVIIIGEYVIDLVDNNEGKYDIHIGGCGLNSAVACANQGVSTMFLSPISQDANGHKVIDFLIDKEIFFDPDFCNSRAPSTLALATISEDSSAKYDFYLKNTASMVLSSEQLLNSISNHSDVKAIHVGSLSMLINPTSSAIYDVLSFLAPKPVVFVDPNIRAQEVEKIPNWQKKLFDFFKLATIIKLSDEDLAFIFPNNDEKAAILEIKKINPEAHILLTRGKLGAIWYTPDNKKFSQDNYEVEVVDTIGSGDTFSGSILAYLSMKGVFGDDVDSPKFRINDNVIKEALKFACYSASLNCSKAGCNPPTLEEVNSIL